MERNSKSNIVAGGGLSAMNNGNAVANGKDTVMGEALLERSQLRKRVQTEKIIHRRRRSKFSIFLTVITKILLLLSSLLYLGQGIYRWTAWFGGDANPSYVAMEYEDRISEVEKSLKITSKMLQVQVEVIDKKTGNEIGTVKTELQKQLEEKRLFLERELKQLESKTDDLGKSLGYLEEMNILRKGEFEDFLNELKSKRKGDDKDKDVNFDEIMEICREIVEKEIEKHAADGLGRVDYALDSGGGKVVSHSEPYVYVNGNKWLAVAKSKSRVHSGAQKMLKPSFGEPGQCFPLQGSSGFVEIRLSAGIIPEAITLEHVSKSVAYDISSAPKDCRVSGWFQGQEDDPSSKSDKMFVLTEFSYDLDKSSVPTFTIPMTDTGVINMVRLDISSNHGHSAFTCIYRIRVHGHEPNSPVAISAQG